MSIKSLIYSPETWVGGSTNPPREALEGLRSSFLGRPLTQSFDTVRHERVGTVVEATLNTDTGELHIVVDIPCTNEAAVRDTVTEKPYLGLEFMQIGDRKDIVIALRVFFLSKDKLVNDVGPFIIIKETDGHPAPK